MKIFAIETSCDETAAAVLSIQGTSERPQFNILANVVSSQVDIHRKYGGIVPEVAARAHIENIIPVIDQALSQAKIKQLQKQIDLIAVTNGPGLITSLLVGTETVKSMAYILDKPLLPVNHLAGHIYASWLATDFLGQNLNNKKIFPAICLVVSGGHTELVLMPKVNQFKRIGQTLDDAAGECLDKVAKILDIGYPGGPAIAAQAAKLSITNFQLPIKLPRPMIGSQDYNFSFSGLKTAALYTTQKQKKLLRNKSQWNDFVVAMCADVQQAVIDVLIYKTVRAASEFKAKTIILCGGVAANKQLREQLGVKIRNSSLRLNFFVPPINFCTDNAVMIGLAAYFKWQALSRVQQKKATKSWQHLSVEPNLEL